MPQRQKHDGDLPKSGPAQARFADAVAIDRFALLGISQGASVAVLYTLLRPEKVSHLILYGGFAQGRLKRAPTELQIQEARMLQQLVRIGWGQKDPTFRRVFASLFLPEGGHKHPDGGSYD